MAGVEFTLEQAPVSQNQVYKKTRHGMIYKSKEGRAYQAALNAAARAAMDGKQPLSGDVAVGFQFYFKSRRNDVDGPLKPSLDALQEGVFANDRCVKQVFIEKFHDPERPRVEVWAEEISYGKKE